MQKTWEKLLEGYRLFRQKYVTGENMVMQRLCEQGQQPSVMIIGCCDSRVDPAIILQCDPGDLFVVRNVANIVPPYEIDDRHHGTSAALEFGIRMLKVKHLIILGHSQCGGIAALTALSEDHNDFITHWVSLIPLQSQYQGDELAKHALLCSYEHCLTFPWLKERLNEGMLAIHLWFFDMKGGHIETFSFEEHHFVPLL